MLRCAPLAALAAALALSLPAAAQTERAFPRSALRGDIRFGQPPEVLLNGQPTRLGPAARIHGPDNLLVMSGGLIGQRGTVNYTFDNAGLLKDVWLLTDAEKAKKPWPATPQESQAWTFDAAAQVWSKP